MLMCIKKEQGYHINPLKRWLFYCFGLEEFVPGIPETGSYELKDGRRVGKDLRKSQSDHDNILLEHTVTGACLWSLNLTNILASVELILKKSQLLTCHRLHLQDWQQWQCLVLKMFLFISRHLKNEEISHYLLQQLGCRFPFMIEMRLFYWTQSFPKS